MKFDSPFFVTRVECPICGKINEFKNIKAGAYAETERDTDFCPKGIIWANPEYQKINPLMYFMATCLNCFYTHEFNQSFKEWKKNLFFITHRLSSIREKHERELKQAGSVINRLGKALDPEGHPFESAVIKLLLGIYDETMIQEFNPWDVGRHYLRLAWLYRENAEARNTRSKADELDLSHLEKMLRRLRANFEDQEEEIRDLWMTVETCFRRPTAVAEQDQPGQPLKTKIAKGLNKIKGEISSLRKSFDELTETCVQSRDLSFDSELENVKITTEIPKSFPSGETSTLGKNHFVFSNPLSSVKEIWPETPLNELEAMEWALRYYRQSYQEVEELGPESHKIQAAYLIAELSRRVGDYQEARNFFEEAKTIGRDFIQKNQNDANKIALAQKILELAKSQGELNLVKAESQV
jgi:uncharacterized protein (DUF2225 family)